MRVCPPGDGWYLLVLNFRIVLVVHRGLAGQVHAVSELGTGAGSAHGLAFSVFLLAGVDWPFLFSCLQGWTRYVDRPTGCCLLGLFLLYYITERRPADMLFNSFFY